MTTPPMVPMTEIEDPDVLAADAALGNRGQRQIRMLTNGDRAYVDQRDVIWLIDNYRSIVWSLTFAGFWAQVATFVCLDAYHSAGGRSVPLVGWDY